MGSGFYTVEETCTILNRTQRCIHGYIKKGLLSKKRVNGRTYIPEEEVQTVLKDVRSRIQVSVSKANFNDAIQRIKRLEDTVELLKTSLNIKNAPLRPSKEMASKLYTVAKTMLMAPTWTDNELETWASTFIQLDEIFFDKVIEAVPDPQPWVPFFNLCKAMLDQMSNRFHKEKTLRNEKLWMKLEDARTHLRNIALVWTESGKGTPEHLVLKATATPKETILNKVISPIKTPY